MPHLASGRDELTRDVSPASSARDPLGPVCPKGRPVRPAPNARVAAGTAFATRPQHSAFRPPRSDSGPPPDPGAAGALRGAPAVYDGADPKVHHPQPPPRREAPLPPANGPRS